MIKIFRKFHLWLAVPFGVIVALICFSGASLVFEEEITHQLQKDVYYVASVGATPLPADSLRAKVAATLPPDVEIKDVKVDRDPLRTYQMVLSKPKKTSVYINQYSGEITGRTERPAFFMTMFKLHRWLLNPPGDSMSVGKLVVGISTAMFALVLISGIFIWYPRVRNGLKRSLTIHLNGGWNKFWRSLHVAGGMYALILLLVMSLTGLTWSFGWYRDGFNVLFGDMIDHRTLFQLHTGGIGGMTTKILWFFAAIIGGTLPLTGYYIWYKRLRSRKH